MKESLRILAHNLNIYLAYYDMSQSELARRLDIASPSVSKWSRGVSSPSWDKIDKMCEMFHCTRGQLLEKEQSFDTIEDNTLQTEISIFVDILTTEGKGKVLEYLKDLNDKYFKEQHPTMDKQCERM